MGRARNQPQATGTDMFAGVLGSARGNFGSNEQRDRQEAISLFIAQTDWTSPGFSSVVSAHGISYLTRQIRGQTVLVATLLTDADDKPEAVRVMNSTVFTDDIAQAAKSAGLDVTRITVGGYGYEINERSLNPREREAFMQAGLSTYGSLMEGISERLNYRQEDVLRNLSQMTRAPTPAPLLMLTVANLLGDRQPDSKDETVPLVTRKTVSDLVWMGLLQKHGLDRVALTADGFAVADFLGEADDADDEY